MIICSKIGCFGGFIPKNHILEIGFECKTRRNYSSTYFLFIEIVLCMKNGDSLAILG